MVTKDTLIDTIQRGPSFAGSQKLLTEIKSDMYFGREESVYEEIKSQQYYAQQMEEEQRRQEERRRQEEIQRLRNEVEACRSRAESISPDIDYMISDINRVLGSSPSGLDMVISGSLERAYSYLNDVKRNLDSIMLHLY